jgi:broad specificity phosphatase PhoE
VEHPFQKHLQRRRLYLFRHAQTLNAKSTSIEYPGDIPLTEVGFDQARAVAEHLRGLSFDVAMSSDFLRSRQTAETILGRRASILETSELLREFQGDFKTMMGDAATYEQALHNMTESMWNISRTFRGSADECGDRVEKLVASLLGREWSVALLVAHSGYNRMLLCRLLGLPYDYMHIFEQDFCGMTIIDMDVEAATGSLHRALLRELNVTPANPAKLESRLTDIENLALETGPLIARLFS